MSNSAEHPLSAAFPGMSLEEFKAYRDAVKPAPQSVIDAMVASAWFKGLTKSQRAGYAVGWGHWADPGSNQHAARISTQSPRFAAEVAAVAIQKAARP